MDIFSINYDKRTFSAVSNSENGEVSNETIFHYHQDGSVFWAEYAGGAVRKGTMIGFVQPDGKLVFLYQHLNINGCLRSGKCESIPEIMPDGGIRLHESWRWNDSNESGTSIVEEKGEQ